MCTDESKLETANAESHSERDGSATENKWWIAINGPAVPASLMAAMPRPKVVPTPQILIGFPTRKEAAEAQRFFLNAPVPDCRAKLDALQRREDVAYFTFKNHGKPDPNLPTMWMQGDGDEGTTTALESVYETVRTESDRRALDGAAKKRARKAAKRNGGAS